MKFLFFDTETTGKPINYKASYTDVNNWPRVAQLAWQVADVEGNVLASENHLIKPDGWVIPKEDFFLEHGMSTERCEEFGVPIAGVLDLFYASKLESDVLVAHNITFDHRIVWAEFIRAGREPRSGMHKICTMNSSTKYCAIPQVGRGGLKWPKLEELYRILFGEDFDGAHDAMADITATRKSFFELVRRGVIALPAEAETAISKL